MSADFDFTYTGGSNSLYFWDGFNNFTNNNAEAIDLGSYPSVTTVRNTALELSTPGDYVRMSTNADIELTGPMTMEAWIYPTVAPTSTHYIITKKGGWNDPGYGIYYAENNGPKVRFKNNATGFYSESNVPLNQWTHIAAVMGQSSAKLYINGKLDGEGLLSFPGANSNNLVIGSIDGGAASESFLGFIDAVKISNYEKSESEINNGMFEVMDFTNRPAPPNSTVSLNFDHFNYSTTGTGTYYYYQNSAKNSAVSYAEDVPVSPILGNSIAGFPEAFHMKSASLRIPEFNTAGFMKEDSIEVSSSLSISDIKLFIALNHGRLSDLEIRLFSPEGDSAVIWNQNSGFNQRIESIVTVFSDDADSALVNFTYVDFSPKIKPYSSLNSAFGGKNSQGAWRLKIIDYYNGDTGMLYGWGLQFNNITKIEEEFDANIPDNFVLEQNYPNPFNPTTTISFSIPAESNVKLEIFDILGRKVATLINGMRTAGTYNVIWDGNNDFGNLLSSGVYFYRLEATGGSNNFVNLKKMVFLK
jgi:subtilisin-like proprotein convertase family protein